MNKKIEILDCTLRDGGYLIDWMFGYENILFVLQNLALAKIDYIECGFLNENSVSDDKAFFKTINDLDNILLKNQKYTFMINYGEFSIKNFSKCKNKNIKIRLAFKKHLLKEALEYVKELKELGWDVFVNPTSTNFYSKEELRYLIDSVNDIQPYALYIVDTIGNMKPNEVEELLDLFDSNLFREISIGFHSHDNLQLSAKNTKVVLQKKTTRNFIIDSCIMGIGRGAGNLATEYIVQVLASKYNSNYLKEIAQRVILPIYNNKDSNGKIYYITASNSCHPNYGKALMKMGFSEKKVDKLLKQIPEENKLIFNNEVLEKICQVYV